MTANEGSQVAELAACVLDLLNLNKNAKFLAPGRVARYTKAYDATIESLHKSQSTASEKSRTWATLITLASGQAPEQQDLFDDNEDVPGQQLLPSAEKSAEKKPKSAKTEKKPKAGANADDQSSPEPQQEAITSPPVTWAIPKGKVEAIEAELVKAVGAAAGRTEALEHALANVPGATKFEAERGWDDLVRSGRLEKHGSRWSVALPPEIPESEKQPLPADTADTAAEAEAA